jgi:copper homeostasis protein
MMNPFLEIAAFDARSAGIAADAGAHRIELCADAPEGGLTPSAGSLLSVKERVHIPVYVMLRPRAGDFCYHAIEKDVIRKDLRLFRKMGADGFVFGALLPNAGIDREFLEEIVSLAYPLPVTFHRAIDRCADPESALEVIAQAGVKTVLSSGAKSDAESGASRIAGWIQRFADRLEIMPGAGIHEGNAAKILSVTGARWLHLSAKMMVLSPGSSGIKMGSGDMEGYQSVNPDIIKNILSIQ